MVEPFDAFPQKFYETGIEIVIVATRRNRSDVLSPQVKSQNYLNNILVKIEAMVAGVQDGLMLNNEGNIAKGTTQNIFIIKQGILYTPPCSQGALEGITRNVVIDLCSNLGYSIKEQPLTRHDVYTADEVFFTGTGAEIIAVVKVDGRIIGDGMPGFHTKKIYNIFKLHVLEPSV